MKYELSEGTAVIRRCVSCRKPITKQDYFINDDGPYCPDCIEAWACAGDQGAANLPPACSGNKPLRWRTGPVPETDKWEEFLVCSPLSATGYGYSIRKGNLIDAGEKHIPLSDILGLVEG